MGEGDYGRYALKAAFLIVLEDLVAGFAGTSYLPEEFGHRLAREPASHKLQTFIHHRTLLPRHHFLPQKKGKSVTYVSGTICHLCLRSLITSKYASILTLPLFGALPQKTILPKICQISL